MKENNKVLYTEVWGDRVILKELAISCFLGVLLTMTFFLIGQRIFHDIESIDKSLADGYALIVGVTGCIISGVISAKLFKPKRKVEEKFEFEDVEEILKSAGITLEEEIQALSTADKDVIAELEDLKLYSLLSLIPKDSPNYKEEYSIKANEV